MPLPLAVSCSNKIQIGFTFLVPAHPGSPRQTNVKRVSVCDKCHCKLYKITKQADKFFKRTTQGSQVQQLVHCALLSDTGLHHTVKPAAGTLGTTTQSVILACITQ